MYFQILLKDFVRNVHLEDVWANTDGPLLFTSLHVSAAAGSVEFGER